MYHFGSIKTSVVVREIKKLATEAKRDLTTSLQEKRKVYSLYVANVQYPIGTLTVKSGINAYGDSWVTVLAELDTDKGRNNTIGVDDMSSEGIGLAIGFTCGAAMFRSNQYRNS